MILHHIFSIIGMMVSLIGGFSATEVMAIIFGTEITNPLLQIRWFLRTLEKHKTWYYEINDALFVLLFVIMRLGIGSNLIYIYIYNPRAETLHKILAIAIYMVGFIFMFTIVPYVYNKYQKYYRLWNKVDIGKSPITNGVSNGSETHQHQL